MDTNIDPKVQEADRRIDQAKESLKTRVDELGRRFKDIKNKVDIEAQIVAHPLPAIGIAFVLGAMVGFRRKSPRQEQVKRAGISGAIIGGLSALVMRMLKDVAIGQLSGAAKTWFDKQQGHVKDQPTERGASRDPAMEAFLEH